MTPTTDARAAIEALQGHEAWAIIRRSTRLGDRDTVGLVGRPAQRGRVDPRRPARGRRPGRGAHRRPAGRDPVPAGGRARLRGARRRHPAGRGRHRDRAGVLGRRGDRRDRRHRHRVRRPGRLRVRRRDVRQARRGDHHRRDRAGRGRQPRHRAALPRGGRRLGRRQGADRLPPAARARARRLLDLRLLHRRPVPDRREPERHVSIQRPDGDERGTSERPSGSSGWPTCG